MLTHLYHRSQIQDVQWNVFIDTSPQKMLYAYSWYLDIVSPDWWALVVEENNEWQAIMPIPIVRKFGMKVVQQPLFCQLLGVFFKENNNSLLCINHIEIAFKRHFKYVSSYAGLLLFEPYTTRNTYIIDLSQSYEVIQNNYHKDRKARLKQVKKSDWAIEKSVDIKPLITLFRTNHANRIEGGVSESAYTLLAKIAQELEKKNVLELLYCSKNGVIEAGAIFVIFGGRIIYLFNAASALGRSGNARTLLIDSILNKHSNSDLVFDFESPEIENIACFYESFGAKAQPYSAIRYNHLPFPFRQIQNWRLEK